MNKNNSEFDVKSITVSYGFDTHKSGSRSHHFVSMNVELNSIYSLNDVHLSILETSKIVTKAAIDSALARGALTVDEANDLLKINNTNHENIMTHRKNQSKESV